MNELLTIQNKIIVITGATGVLGSAMARYLASEGAEVVLLARNGTKAEALQQDIQKNGGKALALKADVTQESDLEAVRQQLQEAYGKVDVLINAAGGNMPGATITPDQSLLDSDVNALRQIIELNYIGTYLPTKVLLPLFLQEKTGSIINISSMSADRPLTRVMGYSSSKAAIDNLTKWLAVEFAQKYGEGLRVNAIAPGFFLTVQNKTLLTKQDGELTDRGQQIIANTPMQRFGRPEELFGAVHYLSSNAANFVTGTIMAVDGGFGAYSGV
ncbi:SDR family oxidoreductase [uncultured Croceitalea sp.]|uniref:SDR family oxidoreductase n=1 Tax=uncultured Croceitalea sp. TaxID=1798908 RepID=UPI003305B871